MGFSAANLLAAFIWASSILWFVAWGGPAWLDRLGLPAWTLWIVPGIVVLVVLTWALRRRAVAGPGGEQAFHPADDANSR